MHPLNNFARQVEYSGEETPDLMGQLADHFHPVE